MMKTKNKLFGDIRRGSSQAYAAHLATAQSELIEANLAEMRNLAGKTQAEVALLIGAAQSHVSQTEAREDHMVSTLRTYVEALGGTLEIIARFDNKTVKLHGV